MTKYLLEYNVILHIVQTSNIHAGFVSDRVRINSVAAEGH